MRIFHVVGCWLQKWYKTLSSLWCCGETEKKLDELLEMVRQNRIILAGIYQILSIVYRVPTSIQIDFEGVTMPVTLTVGQSVIGTPFEKAADDSVVPIPNLSTISYTSDNAAVATATTNPDGTVSVAGLTAGTANVTVTDSANGLSKSDVVTVSEVTPPPPNVATSIGIEWGTPQ